MSDASHEASDRLHLLRLSQLIHRLLQRLLKSPARQERADLLSNRGQASKQLLIRLGDLLGKKEHCACVGTRSHRNAERVVEPTTSSQSGAVEGAIGAELGEPPRFSMTDYCLRKIGGFGGVPIPRLVLEIGRV